MKRHLTLLTGAGLLLCQVSASSASTGFIRVNEVGYTITEEKTAVLLCDATVTGTFNLVDPITGIPVYTAPIPGRSERPWNNRFQAVYLLDFTNLTIPGNYSLRVNATVPVSPVPIQIDSGSNLYRSPLANVLFYFQAQRDGPDVVASVLGRQPSHLTDQTASVYWKPDYNQRDLLTAPLTRIGGSIDVSGGWFDAGDYVKFVETTSYVEAVMLFALREYPELLCPLPLPKRLQTRRL